MKVPTKAANSLESLKIARIAGPNDDVRALIAELEETLAAEYSAEQRHGLSLDAIFQPHIHFFVASLGHDAVGCGGIALFGEAEGAEAREGRDSFAEIKRMFVRPSARGRGVADAILAELESVARAAGIRRVCLETGDKQVAAMRLYERLGFSACSAFGQYVAMPPASVVTSVFYEKLLSLNGE